MVSTQVRIYVLTLYISVRRKGALDLKSNAGDTGKADYRRVCVYRLSKIRLEGIRLIHKNNIISIRPTLNRQSVSMYSRLLYTKPVGSVYRVLPMIANSNCG